MALLNKSNSCISLKHQQGKQMFQNATESTKKHEEKTHQYQSVIYFWIQSEMTIYWFYFFLFLKNYNIIW